ncbi:cobaltochelatase subunit CobN [Thermosulfuriphilus sp.]
MYRFIYYTSSGTELTALGRAARRLKAEGLPVEIIARSRLDIFDNREIEKLAASAARAVAVILAPHGGDDSIPGYLSLLESARQALIHIQPTGGSDEDQALAARYCDLDSPAFKRRFLYLRYGDEENLYRFFKDLFFTVSGRQEAAPPPVAPLFEGIYHPEYSGPGDLEAYLSWAKKRLGMGAPVVGIWFYQGYYLSGDLDPVDEFIKAFESQGIIPLAVFHRRFVDQDLPARSPTEVVECFFKLKGTSVIRALVSLQPFSMTLLWPETAAIYPGLKVSVLQALTSFSSRRSWEAEHMGLSPMELSISVAQPEFDGCLITTLVATREIVGRDEITGARLARFVPLKERLLKVARQATAWAKLASLPPSEKKVAIVFHHYPPRAETMGCAFGLDSFESVVRLLKSLKKAGFKVDRLYKDGDELARELLTTLIHDRRYLPARELAKRAIAALSPGDYVAFCRSFSSRVQEELSQAWGSPPGEVFVHEGRLLIGGLINGHIFIGLQPPRGHLERLEGLSPEQLNLHDPGLPPTYHYLCFYRWLKEGFGAQVVIHVGKHGSLEWLPGKAVALSEDCYPDVAIDDLANVYPYIVNDPGEGTQAKRRSYCAIIDHMIPPQMAAGRYGALEEMAEKINQWHILRQESPAKADLILEDLKRLIEETHLAEDIPLSDDEAPESLLKKIHDYLEEIAETNVNDGLHILGEVPEGQRLWSTLAAMLKVPSGPWPSPFEVLKELLPQASAPERYAHLEALIKEALKGQLPEDPRLKAALGFVREELYPRVLGIKEEMDYLMETLSGGFVPPGPSGAPTRGNTEVLPTGRNFYSVDPLKIPSPEAWEIGRRHAEALVAKYFKEHGRYPQAVAMVIWGSPTMRTRGDDFAEALYLLGVRPLWQEGSGRIRDIEVIPTQELKFPRIDVTIRTSGFFRDAFPNLMELFDRAVRLVAALKEPPEKNFLAAHVKRDLQELLKKGLSREEALRQATFRVFSDRPGTYGSGIPEVLDAGSWEAPEDLGEVYIRWGGICLRGEDVRSPGPRGLQTSPLAG